MKKDSYLKLIRWKKESQRVYSISKHDKDNPHYVEEWDSFSDIGEVFPGGQLTITHFRLIEEAYIRVVQDVLRLCNCNCLYLVYTELYKRRYRKQQDSLFSLNRRVPFSHIPFFIEGMMRDDFYVVLQNTDKRIMIDFGYDLYMHICCPLTWDKMRDIVKHNGLYINHEYDSR